MYEHLSPEALRFIGKAVERPDAAEKLTGQARYVSDLSPPGHALTPR